MYSFIDVEASGLGCGSYPIEVGVVFADDKASCTLICPANHWTHWDHQAQQLHGISRESLLINGRSVLKVAMMLNEWLDGQVVYSDAWGNDSCWLANLFAEAGITQRFRVDSIVSVLSCEEAENWDQAKSLAQSELNLSRHRASNDALVLKRTIEILRNSESVQVLHNLTG